MKLKRFLKRAGRKVKLKWNKHGQLVMTGLTIGTVIGAVVDAVRKSGKAVEIKEEREDRMNLLTDKLQDGDITQDEFEKERRQVNIDTAKEYVICYGSTFVLLAVCVGSTVLNYKVALGKQATLLAAYKLAESQKGEIESKARELLGDKKYEEITTAITKDHMDNTPVPEGIKDPEYETDEDGNFVPRVYPHGCWLEDTMAYFIAKTSEIGPMMNEISDKCYSNNSITMNEVYEILDPSGKYLRKSAYGATHGFIASDLDNHKKIPYSVEPIYVDGYEQPFSCLKFDKQPALLGWD